MSTTFAIIKSDKTPVFHEETEELNIEEYFEGEVIEIATRGNNGKIYWKYPVAIWSNIPDETGVYPVDNTPQGIYCIGDLKKQYEK